MAILLPSNTFIWISKFVAKKIDWQYFQLCAIISAMYLFNMIAVSFLETRVSFANSILARIVTSYPLLTLIYLAALFEMFDLKLLVGILTSRRTHSEQ
jgi:hypothetical protein